MDPNAPFVRPYCLGFHFNKQTGEIQFKATKTDMTVICIEVDQWHKDSSGVYKNIGSITRQTTLAIINCGPNHPPIITGINGGTTYSTTNCLGSPVNFLVKAFDLDPSDTDKMVWDNAIPGATFKVDTVVKWPTGTFSWSPKPADYRAEPYNFFVTVTDNASPIPGTTVQMFTIYLVADSFPSMLY